MGPPSRATRTPSWKGTSVCAGVGDDPLSTSPCSSNIRASIHACAGGEGRAHDHHMIPESPQGADLDRAVERRATPSERHGVLDRKQDDPNLVRRKQVRETPAGPGPGYPSAGLREVLLEERLDFLRFRIARRVFARSANHEMALAVDLPLAVGGVCEEPPDRTEQCCAREDCGEKGAPAGAPLACDSSLSCGTCRTHRGSERPSPRSSGRPRPVPRADPRRRWPGCTPALGSARAPPGCSRSSG